MKRILAAVLLNCCLVAHAQRTTPFTNADHAISFNPLALALIDYTVLAGYEQKLKPKLYLATEVGYIFASSYITDQERQSVKASGFMIRPSLKWFFNSSNRFYLQPQVFYKQVTHQLYDWLGKEAVNGVPSYEEKEEFKYRRKIFGFNGVAGMMVPMNGNGTFYMDFYLGLGIRYKRSKLIAEPNSVYTPSTIITAGDADPDNITLPGVPMGLRLIFVVK